MDTYLRRQILQADTRTPLPSVRQIMQQCGVGQATVKKVLDSFESEGLIRTLPRKGTFKIADRSMAELVPVVDFIACGRVDPFLDRPDLYSGHFLGSLNHQITRNGQSLRFHQLWRKQPLADYENLAARPDMHAALLFGANLPEIPAVFQQRHIACISMFPRCEHDGPSVLDANDFTSRIMEHLFGLGHTRIAWLGSRDERIHDRLEMDRRSEYYRFMAEHGLRVNPAWVANPGYREQETSISAFEQALTAEPRPTALVVHAHMVIPLYRFLERKGLKIGRDVSVVSIDEYAPMQDLTPPATTVSTPADEAIRLAMSSLGALTRGQDVPHKQIVPARLVARDSTGPAPKDT